MERILKITGDGSPTIYLPELDEHYHSVHGALQEAQHVFIKNGLLEFKNQKEINILEIGFGTGLNCFLTCIEGLKYPQLKINYIGVESNPLSNSELIELNYTSLIEHEKSNELYRLICEVPWQNMQTISSNFNLKKIESKLQNLSLTENQIDIIFYDAFGPRAQKDMWEIECFVPLYSYLKQKGLLVTYCAQGQFKRNLKQIGFQIEARQGPPGKREMTLAWKIF